MKPVLRRSEENAVGQALPAVRGPGRIVIDQLTKTFSTPSGTLTALSNTSLAIAEGEFLCLVGPSGCGKTTVLRTLAGLEAQTSGTVTISIDANDRPLRSMVFQGNGVFPWMTVLDNAAYGLAVRGVPKKERHAIARDYLQKLGLGPFEQAYPRQLSGGMLQRVNLARAFANDPAILLMDEPFGALDEQTRIIVYQDLLRLWEGSRKTVIFVTHSLNEAIILGDRIAVMAKRPGRIKEVIDVRLPRPRDVLDLENDEEFLTVRRRVWTALRSEVVSLQEEMDDAKGCER
jgi:NitT/TauT family transport system ATP-binding protein